MLDKVILDAVAQNKIIVVLYKDDDVRKHGWIYFYNCDLKYDEITKMNYFINETNISDELIYRDAFYILIQKNNVGFQSLIKELFDHYNHLIFCYTDFIKEHFEIINNEIKKRYCSDRNLTTGSEVGPYPGRLEEYFVKRNFKIQLRFLTGSDLISVKDKFLNYMPITLTNNDMDDVEFLNEDEKEFKGLYIENIQSALNNDSKRKFIYPDSLIIQKNSIEVQHFDNVIIDETKANYTPKSQKEKINER